MAFFKFMNYLDFNMSNSTHILCKKKKRICPSHFKIKLTMNK